MQAASSLTQQHLDNIRSFYQGAPTTPGRLARHYRAQLAHYYNLLIPVHASVLEIGCGAGELLARLHARRKVGVDLSPHQIEAARARVPAAEFHVQAGETLELVERFDCIIISETLNQAADVQQLLMRLHRVSHPHTRLVFNYFSNLWRPLLAVATAFGLHARQPQSSWISSADVRNLLHLADWEPMVVQPRILVPFPCLGLDVAVFVSYGLLLLFGFYLQSWTVFPAAAQGAFLVFKHRSQLFRFLAHLALVYFLVISFTWPYLQAHQQKINVGLWSRETVTLSGQLYNGFHLLLSGHMPGQHWLTSLLPWAWGAIVAAAGSLLYFRPHQMDAGLATRYLRQLWLVSLSMAVPLIFQIGYFYKVDPLSVWPRYFVIHYFFLTWWIALSFRLLHHHRNQPGLRSMATPFLAGATLLLAASAVYQIRSYHRDPYFDTGLSPATELRAGANLLSQIITPSDVVAAHEYIMQGTLSFTRPLPNPILTFSELTAPRLAAVQRIVYLEPPGSTHMRTQLEEQLNALGFGPARQLAPILDGPVDTPLPWRVIAFSRP